MLVDGFDMIHPGIVPDSITVSFFDTREPILDALKPVIVGDGVDSTTTNAVAETVAGVATVASRHCVPTQDLFPGEASTPGSTR